MSCAGDQRQLWKPLLGSGLFKANPSLSHHLTMANQSPLCAVWAGWREIHAPPTPFSLARQAPVNKADGNANSVALIFEMAQPDSNRLTRDDDDDPLHLHKLYRSRNTSDTYNMFIKNHFATITHGLQEYKHRGMDGLTTRKE